MKRSGETGTHAASRHTPQANATRAPVVALPTLDRRFEAIVFDWDGTAVPDRAADGAPVRTRIEALSAAGMDLVVVSGTHVGNIDDQLRARPAGPGRLLFALNRGSEIFDVGEDGPRLRTRRVASSAEDAALTRAATLTVERLAAIGLVAEVVSQRLNRRKIDLIPEPEWTDPPKAHIDALLRAVQARLTAAGIAGLPTVVALAAQAARDAGLPDARVTSDAKHVEIGLTDKADSARAVFVDLWAHGIAPELVLIAGDEVGPLGGLPGSDSLMLVPEARGARAVSVGVEPTGVPAGVVHLPGGPASFAAILDDQLRRRREREVPTVARRPGWYVAIDGVDHATERAREALLTIADGRIGTSGAPLLTHPSATANTFVGGVYDGEGPGTHLAELPSWDRLPGLLTGADRLERVLDLRTGILAERAAALGLASVRFVARSAPGTGVLRARLDHELSEPADTEEVDVVSSTNGGVAIAVGETSVPGSASRDRIAVYEPFTTGDDTAAERALARVRLGTATGFDALLAGQRTGWAQRWEHADVAIDGDAELQLAMRLGLFHLMASVPDDGEAAVGARGLSGPGYRGHVFWDADVFVLPFLAATYPEAARAMLEYRVRRLPAALAAARAEGRSGARFAWESAATGADVTPSAVRDLSGHLVPIRTGELEVHVVADVAWAVACYLDWTGDANFAAGDGHRILVETARYWEARARHDHDGAAHLYGVIGPDEYHEPVDDNAFTNVMARWNLRRAAASARQHGGIDPAEIATWCSLADALIDGYDPEARLYEQFAGFFTLEPLVIAEVAPHRPIVADYLLGRERVRGAQVVKQADVLMLHHLVPDETAPGSLVPNLEYYEPRTAHGSSLSPGVHASLLARASRLEAATSWLRIAARVDRDDLTGTTATGLHLATMGSVWQALVWGFAGIRPAGEHLVIDPRLPHEWDELEVRLRFRGAPMRIHIDHDYVCVDADAPTSILVDGNTHGVGAEPLTLSVEHRR
ncbi:MAG: glycosyl hydrolase family 65 protein [Actinomycetota bacterium]